jgi:hypothetical protein
MSLSTTGWHLRVGIGKKITLRSALRVSMPVTILLFCAGFNYSYVKWVSPVWSYTSLTYRPPDIALVIVGYALASITCAFSPLRIRRASQGIYWFLFFTVFIPGLFVPLYLQLDNGFTLLLIQVSLASGMLLIGCCYRIPLLNFRLYPVNPGLFWGVFGVLFVVGNAAVLYTFRGMLQIASIETVYSVRLPAREVLRAHPAIGYTFVFLGSVMNPILMGYGLFSRKRLLFVLGTLGEIVLYSAVAEKQQMLAPLLVFILYYTIKRDRGGWVPKMGLFFTGLLFVLTTISVGIKPGPIFNLSSVVLVRTFTTPGAEIGQYQYFFENNPHTYFGQVTGINLLVTNPYPIQMGEEVSQFYGIMSAHGPVNANANFFAMDGISGFGLPGIPVMGILCGFVFWFLDSCAARYPLEISIPVLAMIIMSLANVSLFTTLLGNGLMALMLLFLVFPENFRRVDLSS